MYLRPLVKGQKKLAIEYKFVVDVWGLHKPAKPVNQYIYIIYIYIYTTLAMWFMWNLAQSNKTMYVIL